MRLTRSDGVFDLLCACNSAFGSVYLKFRLGYLLPLNSVGIFFYNVFIFITFNIV